MGCPDSDHDVIVVTYATPEEIKRARDLYCDSSFTIEVDDDARTCQAAGGQWVQAWVWLKNELSVKTICEENVVWGQFQHHCPEITIA